jgi:predicted metalloprotease
MRWTSRGRSADLEDRRGFSVGRAAPLGIGGVVLLAILSLVTGQNFFDTGTGEDTSPVSSTPAATSPEEEKLIQFVSFVLDDSQDTWTKILGNRYERAKLVLFTDATESGCGFAQSATGPFYCPVDRKVYIDLGFYRELRERFGAGGEFAQAYVLAHEIGHHVQTLLGTEQRIRQAMEMNPGRQNELSVRLELQADCYAGVWGNSTSQRQILEQSDVEDGLNAAAAIGDDRIARMSGTRIAPERFTHGSSAQRVEWFKRGLTSGRPESCDTGGG